MTINFYSKVKGSLAFNQQWLLKVITKAAGILKTKNNQELTVLVVNDQEIKALNKKYRGENKITDVLSFSQREGEKIVLPGQAKNYLGDIVICYPQIKRQAKIFRQPIKKEFCLLLLHGFLHLLGYEDDSQAGCLKMSKLQDKILARIYV